MFTLLYPGQGSQQPGMGRYLYDQFRIAKDTFEEGSDALGIDMKKLCFEGSETDLALTENTQPALLLVSTATQRVIREEFPIKIQSAAGHSIGEYAALVSSHVLPFSSAMKAVRIRGQAMQAAVPVGQGGMVAVMGLDPVQVSELCQYVVQESKLGPLSPANYNSPGQIVISGSQKAIDWMKENVTAEKIWGDDGPKRMKLIPLQVSAPFHCEMMKPAEDKMRQVLSDIPFQKAEFPILQNYTADFHTEAHELKENLIRQVSAPVLWMQSMEKLKQRNWLNCIECGTGKVIQGLLKKIDGEAFKVLSTNSIDDLKLIESAVKGWQI
ncbi:MAG: malonyl CoA-acyl carrier protein transacylase [Candidatus Jettenia caeni]|nr:MAG: malonyl CoA-acyl carrier protein transacylase [Candidatus Jettenia caeni]